MNDDNIKDTPIDSINTDVPKRRHELSVDLVDRIKAFKKILSEVERIPVEKTIDNFLYDKNPEIEIAMWEAIAEVYGGYVSAHPKASFDEKIEVYKVALISSGKPLNILDQLSLQYIKEEVALSLQGKMNKLLESKIGKPHNPITVTSGKTDDEIVEDIYPGVRAYIMTQKIAKASEIQSHFNVGYEIAAKLLDKLEEEGVTEKGEGASPRKVII